MRVFLIPGDVTHTKTTKSLYYSLLTTHNAELITVSVITGKAISKPSVIDC